MRLLLVEDHPDLAIWLAKALEQSGHVVEHVARGDHADYLLLENRFDLVILDLSLPGLDGLDVLRRLRTREQYGGHLTPVLILTARGDLHDRVTGLNLGADDYLAKPFEMAELEARVRALLRRHGHQTPQMMMGHLRFDTTTRQLFRGAEELNLTPRELALFEILAARLGKPVAREAIFDKLFSLDSDSGPKAVELYVHRLRKKLEGAAVTIETLRGLGYALREEKALDQP